VSTTRSRPTASAKAALLTAAAVAVTGRDPAGLARALGAARRAGLGRRALEELGLMLRLYAGYPASIEFLRALDHAWPHAAASRVARTVARRRASQGAGRGEALCRRVYGPEYVRLRRFMQRLHPDLDRWMLTEGYGDTLTRPGLTLRERELATVAALAALGWAQQLAAHESGAVRVGASPLEVARARRIGQRCRARTRS